MPEFLHDDSWKPWCSVISFLERLDTKECTQEITYFFPLIPAFKPISLLFLDNILGGCQSFLAT